MNRNQRRRLDLERYKAQNNDLEDRLIAAITLGLRRKYGFSAAKCGKVIHGMRLVVCDAAHRRRMNTAQIILFCAKETEMDPSEIIRGRDALEDINLAADMMALYSNCGFRRKRLLASMEAIGAVLDQYRENSGAEMIEIMKSEVKLNVM